LLLAYREPLDWPALRASLGGEAVWRRALDGGGEVFVEARAARDALRVTVASARSPTLRA
jgi:hypothetical protein